ncbi:MAG: spore maturation protein [Bacillota bacterium]
MFYNYLSIAGSWFIPIFLLLVFIHGAYKKVPLYETFVEGAKEGLAMAVRLLPYVVGIYVAVGIFRTSGAMEAILTPFKPVLSFLGVPAEVLPLMVVRPLSGPAALGVTSDLIDKYGPDSFIGRLASTLDGSCDTTLYILAIYFASVGIKNPRYSLPIGLMADFAGFAASVVICRVVFL